MNSHSTALFYAWIRLSFFETSLVVFVRWFFWGKYSSITPSWITSVHPVYTSYHRGVCVCEEMLCKCLLNCACGLKVVGNEKLCVFKLLRSPSLQINRPGFLSGCTMHLLMCNISAETTRQFHSQQTQSSWEEYYWYWSHFLGHLQNNFFIYSSVWCLVKVQDLHLVGI